MKRNGISPTFRGAVEAAPHRVDSCACEWRNGFLIADSWGRPYQEIAPIGREIPSFFYLGHSFAVHFEAGARGIVGGFRDQRSTRH